MLSAMPNEDQTLAIAWSSSAVGHHEVRIVGLQGTLLSTTAWSRNVRDPQTSTIILPTDALATGVYVVCLETAEGVLSVPVVIR
jgi:hypothetical protein